MIQGVLGELAPGEEVVEAPGAVEEEEGSSSTPGKEDAKDGGATSTVQIVDVLTGQPEVLPTTVQPAQPENVPQSQTPILIEESVPEAGERSLEALELGEEVRTTPPTATSNRGPVTNRGPTFLRVSLDPSPYYERLRRKRPTPSTTIPLHTRGTRFSKIFLVFSGSLNLFVMSSLLLRATFLNSIAWLAFWSLIISCLYDSVRRLKKHIIMDVLREVLKDVRESGLDG